MEPVVLENISFNLDQESFMKEMRIKNSYIAKFKGLMEEALAIAKPKAIYKKAVPESMGDSSIVIDGVTLNSRVVTVNLQGISEFFPAVAACGKELEEWANSFDDMLLNFWGQRDK